MDKNKPCSKDEERQCIGEEGMIGWFFYELEEKRIALWRDGLLFQLGRDFRKICKPFWMNVERRKFFWITLFANVSQLKWIILKEPFEDQKYLGTHFKYQIKITLG
jgi:hypothetical protein